MFTETEIAVDAMIESNEIFTESRQLVETATTLLKSCQRTTAGFLKVEVALSATFAQTALNSFAAGNVEKARRSCRTRSARDDPQVPAKVDGARERISSGKADNP